MTDTINGKTIKELVPALAPDADVVVVFNGERTNQIHVRKATIDQSGDLVLEVEHFCDSGTD